MNDTKRVPMMPKAKSSLSGLANDEAAKGVIRVNVSVARELKARMDHVAALVNWSAVASQAFQAKLLEVESEKESETLQEVIERLRASKAKTIHEEYQSGHQAGETWVKNCARVRHLERVEKLITDVNKSYTDGLGSFLRECGVLQERGVSPFSLAEQVYFQMFSQHHGDRAAAAAFWKAALDNDAAKAGAVEFVRGFLEGANELWCEVKEQVETGTSS